MRRLAARFPRRRFRPPNHPRRSLPLTGDHLGGARLPPSHAARLRRSVAPPPGKLLQPRESATIVVR
jgi:hypothetical protein